MAVRIVATIISKLAIPILLIVFGATVGLIAWSVLTTDLPDFAQPAKGFETRGTKISDRMQTWDKLEGEIFRHKSHFKRYPSHLEETSSTKSRPTTTGSTAQPRIHDTGNMTANSSDVLEPEELGLTDSTRVPTTTKPKIGRPNRFCKDEPLSGYYMQLVFEVGEYESPEMLRALCEVEQKLVEMELMNQYQYCSKAELKNKNHQACCQAWHLSSLTAGYTPAFNCSTLNEYQWWPKLWERLLTCKARQIQEAPSHDINYRNKRAFTVFDDCLDPIFGQIYKFYLPKMFPVFDADKPNRTVMFLPYSRWVGPTMLKEGPLSRKMVESFTETLSVPGAKLVGMELGLREHMFNIYLKRDAVLACAGLVLVLFCMWAYTGSVWFTLATIFAIVGSAGLSYVIYQSLLKMPFFPFMNLITVVLLIGIGADDAFILRQAWQQAKVGVQSDCLVEVLHKTMAHACLSMLVTSLTTAAAFFANMISDMVAIKCFGVFAGTTILVNYFFIISWLPAALVLIEQASQCSKCSEKACCKCCGSAYQRVADCLGMIFEKAIPWMVSRLSAMWVLFFLVLTGYMAFSLFYKPGLRLPTKEYFQYFKSSHPFEVYEGQLRNEFEYSAKGTYRHSMPIHIVFGFDAGIGSNTFNPDDHNGTLKVWTREKFKLRENLNLLFMQQFCDKLMNADFTIDYKIESCFITGFMEYMQQECDSPNGEDLRPCCKENPFPFKNPNLTEECIGRYAFKNRRSTWSSLVFYGTNETNSTDRWAGVMMTFFSQYNFSHSYIEMRKFHRKVNRWVKGELGKGPVDVREGWFSSWLPFFDLQRALIRGTVYAVLIALPIAYLVLFVITQNPLLSLLSILSITGVIIATIGVLVLMEWELNILESTVIILAIGLSFDFTLHYAVAYRLSNDVERQNRVRFALTHVGSAVFMSAITTFSAGSVMIASMTLAFFQIGFFLMLLSCVSWLYSTFFFCSLLHLVGPSGDCCQLICNSKSEEPYKLTTGNDDFDPLRNDEYEFVTQDRTKDRLLSDDDDHDPIAMYSSV